MDKKGEYSGAKTAGIIFLVIVGAVVFLLFGFVVGGARVFGYERMCQYGCVARDNVEALGIYLLDEFCVAHHTDVYPDDWIKCNSTFEEEQDASSCLAEQMAGLARSCWIQRGAGMRECGDLRCYIITIHPTSDEYEGAVSVSTTLIENIMRTYKPTGKSTHYSDDLPLSSIDFTYQPRASSNTSDRCNMGEKERWEILYDEEWGLKVWSEDGVAVECLGDLKHTIDFNKRATDVRQIKSELDQAKEDGNV